MSNSNNDFPASLLSLKEPGVNEFLKGLSKGEEGREGGKESSVVAVVSSSLSVSSSSISSFEVSLRSRFLLLGYWDCSTMSFRFFFVSSTPSDS